MKPDFDMMFIAGPTASGKSSLGLMMAGHLNGAIINADSMQVYSNMPIITAAPNEKEQNAVPHYLFGHINPAQRYSQADWLHDVTHAVATIRANGQLPILVGGTGFYFKAASEGIVPMPDVSSDVKAQAQAMLNEAGNQGLHARLAEVDPDLATRLEPGDSQRVLRGMEVWLASHIPLSKWQKGVAKGRLLGRPLSVYLRPPRDVLYRRINSRFEQMVEHGAIDEISALHARHLDDTLPAMKAVGVRPILDMLKNIINKEKAIELAQRDSRRYAKRQFTWFDHQYNADVVIDYFPEDERKEMAIHTVLSNFQKEFAEKTC